MTTETKKEIAAVEPQKKAMATVRDMLGKMKGQIEAALPKHMSVDRMMRVALTSVQKNPALLECAPVTLIGAVVQCAQLGLEPDDGTGKAYLVPFNNKKKGRREVQFIAGYRGLIDLARRSGQVGPIEARVVHAKDTFRYEFGLDAVLEHVPSQEADPGPAVAFYAVARFKDGGAQFDVMTKAEVDAIRSKAQSSNSPAWTGSYDEMGKKTVVRRICKLLPLSAEVLKAVVLDERAEIGLPQDLGLLVDPAEMGTQTDENQDPPLIEPARKSEAQQEAPATAAGAPAQAPAKVTELQVKKILEEANEHQVTLKEITTYISATHKVDTLANLPQEKFQDVLTWVKGQLV